MPRHNDERRRKPSKQAKFCRAGHRLKGNVVISGIQRKCKTCRDDYLVAYALGWRSGAKRTPIVKCKRGHPFKGNNVYKSPGGQRNCRKCEVRRRLYRASLAKHNRRKVCAHGHRMVEGNTFLHGIVVKCRMCQRNWQAKFDMVHGVRRRPPKQPKNEVEFWEKVLKDFGLHMSRGEFRLEYGDIPVLMAEQAIVHLRYAKGHLRKHHD
jgi:hypothetical protein